MDFLTFILMPYKYCQMKKVSLVYKPRSVAPIKMHFALPKSNYETETFWR